MGPCDLCCSPRLCCPAAHLHSLAVWEQLTEGFVSVSSAAPVKGRTKLRTKCALGDQAVSVTCFAPMSSRLEGPNHHYCDPAGAAQPCHHPQPSGHGGYPAPDGGAAAANSDTSGNPGPLVLGEETPLGVCLASIANICWPTFVVNPVQEHLSWAGVFCCIALAQKLPLGFSH